MQISSAIPAEIAERQYDGGEPRNPVEERSEDEAQELYTRRYAALLKDSDHIWEALGPDGTDSLYPEKITRTLGVSTETRGRNQKAMQAFTKLQAERIGRAFRDGEFVAFARILWDQLAAHTAAMAELDDE